MPKILVVDDDDAIRDTLYTFSLKSIVPDGRDCERLLQARGRLLRRMLTDISMPGLSGLELLGHYVRIP